MRTIKNLTLLVDANLSVKSSNIKCLMQFQWPLAKFRTISLECSGVMPLSVEIRSNLPGQHICHSNSNSVKKLRMLRHWNQRVGDDCAAGRDRRHSDPWKSRVTAAEELGDWCCLPRESGFSSFYGWTIGSPIPSEKSLVC